MRDGPRNRSYHPSGHQISCPVDLRFDTNDLRRRLLRISRVNLEWILDAQPARKRISKQWSREVHLADFPTSERGQSCHDPVKGHGNSGKNKRREDFRMTQTDTANDQSLRTLIDADLQDTLDEELELELDDTRLEKLRGTVHQGRETMDRSHYFRELLRLQGELVKLQDWVQYHKLKVVVIFEGRDSAGKGGVIKRITQRLNPRICKIAALPAPSERERTQWYFQRYVTHLPAGGEIVLFDRSWYNRAGVERVMGFCNEDQCEEFFRSVPEFERMLVRAGILLVKYWFSITDDEQQFRFLMRIHDPLKQWKLSPMDVQSRARWEQYTRAKEEMLNRTHIPEAPWWVVEAVDKKRARLNCISHLLTQIPYEDVRHEPVVLPDRVRDPAYHREKIPVEMYIPERF